MRKIFAVLSVLVAISAKGYALEPTTGVAEQLQSTNTCHGVTISSSTGSEIAGPADNLYRYVAIQNLDSSYDLNCGDTVDVSTITLPSVNNKLGIAVAKGSPRRDHYLYPCPWSVVVLQDPKFNR